VFQLWGPISDGTMKINENENSTSSRGGGSNILESRRASKASFNKMDITSMMVSEQQLQSIKVPPPPRPPPPAAAATNPKLDEKKGQQPDTKKKKKNTKPKKHLLVFDALEVVTAHDKLKNAKAGTATLTKTNAAASTPTVNQRQQPQEPLAVVKLPSSKKNSNNTIAIHSNNNNDNYHTNNPNIPGDQHQHEHQPKPLTLEENDENSESQYFGKVDLAAIIPPRGRTPYGKANNKKKKKVDKKNLLESPVVVLPAPQSKKNITTATTNASGGFWNSLLEKVACGFRPTDGNQSAMLLDDYETKDTILVKQEPMTPATVATVTTTATPMDSSPNTPSLTDWESQQILDISHASGDDEDAAGGGGGGELACTSVGLLTADTPIMYIETNNTATNDIHSQQIISTLMVEIGSEEKEECLNNHIQESLQEQEQPQEKVDPVLDLQLKKQREKKYYANKVSLGYEIDMVDDDVKTIYTLQGDKDADDVASMHSRDQLWDHIDQTHIDFLRSMSDISSTTVGTSKSNLSRKSRTSIIRNNSSTIATAVTEETHQQDMDSTTDINIKEKLQLCKKLFPDTTVHKDDLLLPVTHLKSKSSMDNTDAETTNAKNQDPLEEADEEEDCHSVESSHCDGKPRRYKLKKQVKKETKSPDEEEDLEDDDEEDDDISTKASIGSISIRTDRTTKETQRSKKTNLSLFSEHSDASYSNNLEDEEIEEDGIGSLRSAMGSVVSKDEENELNVLRRIFSSGLSNLPNVLIGDFSNVPSVKMMKRLDQLEDFSERRHYKSKFGSRFVENDFTHTTREEVFFTKMIMDDVQKMVEQPKESALDKKFLVYQTTKELNNTLKDDSMPVEAEAFSIHSEEEEEVDDDSGSEAFTEMSSIAGSTYDTSSFQQALEELKSVRSDHTSIVSCKVRKR
jgi:hypothetical protein